MCVCSLFCIQSCRRSQDNFQWKLTIKYYIISYHITTSPKVSDRLNTCHSMQGNNIFLCWDLVFPSLWKRLHMISTAKPTKTLWHEASADTNQHHVVHPKHTITPLHQRHVFIYLQPYRRNLTQINTSAVCSKHTISSPQFYFPTCSNISKIMNTSTYLPLCKWCWTSCPGCICQFISSTFQVVHCSRYQLKVILQNKSKPLFNKQDPTQNNK